MWHPASLLLSWVGFAFAMQQVGGYLLYSVVLFCILLGALWAPRRSRRLLWGSRWLILSLVILFLFFTSGEYLPGFAGLLGVTFEGLWRAGEHISRLLAMLVGLALLHERIGTNGLVAGLYWMSGPFAWRKAMAVRLMLVLEFAEEGRQLCWREWLTQEAMEIGTTDSFSLVIPRLHLRDLLLMGGLLVSGLTLALWP